MPSTNPEPQLLQLATLQQKPLRWLWPERIALGKLNLLAGPSGGGKTCVALDIAARTSTGKPWPNAPEQSHTPGGVLLVTDEANLADTVLPRLDAAGADLARINAITSLSHDPLRPQAPCDTPRVHDLERLEAAIENTPDCRLVLLDPIFPAGRHTVAVGQTGNSVTLAPLGRLAARREIALLAVATIRTANSAAGLLDAVTRLPSIALAGTVSGTVADPRDPHRRWLLPLKSTITHNTPALAYRITATNHTPCVEWEDQPVHISVEVAFDDRQACVERRDAAGWLEIALSDGPVRATSLLEQAQVNGFSTRAARNALATLGGIRFRKGFGRGGNWYWALNQQQVDEEQSRPITAEEEFEDAELNRKELLADLEAELFTPH